MSGQESFSIILPTAATTAPGSGEIHTIFDSTVAFGPRQIRHLPIKRITYEVENDQEGTLTLYRSGDGGATWDAYSATAVTVPATFNISGPYDFLIDTFEDVKLEWTNGATLQGTWKPTLHGIETRVPGN